MSEYEWDDFSGASEVRGYRMGAWPDGGWAVEEAGCGIPTSECDCCEEGQAEDEAEARLAAEAAHRRLTGATEPVEGPKMVEAARVVMTMPDGAVVSITIQVEGGDCTDAERIESAADVAQAFSVALTPVSTESSTIQVPSALGGDQ